MRLDDEITRIERFEKRMFIAIGLFIAAVIAFAIAGMIAQARHHERLMKSCLVDRPEYECYGLIYGRRR